MRKNSIVFILGLCPIAVTSSHFAYGIIMSISVWIVFFSGLLSQFASELISLNKQEKIFKSIFSFSLVLIYVSVMKILFPVIFISIELYIYLLAVSYIMYVSIQDYYTYSEAIELPLIYSLLILLLSFLRELCAFGSLSFPAISGFAVLNIFKAIGISPHLRFLGTTAGAVIVLGIFCRMYFLISKKR